MNSNFLHNIHVYVLENVIKTHIHVEMPRLSQPVDVTRLLQGCHKVENVSNPRFFQGCGQVVTT